MKTKLHIFKEVANHLSFTKAAEHLFISQPAVSKAIRLLEEEYKTSFFLRKRNSIELTQEGKTFLGYVNKILDLYAELENQFLSLDEHAPRHIELGASTTLANYIIPKIIAAFNHPSPKTTFSVTSGNSKEIEELILNRQLNFGITEGSGSHRKLQFKKFIKDELVLVTNAQNKQIPSGSIAKQKLSELSYAERELGSGTRKMIYSLLNSFEINKLNTVITLSSTEAIKNYLYHSDAYSLLSIHAVKDDIANNKLKIIEIKNLKLERWFYFISRTGYKSKVMDYFERLVKNNYNL